MALAMVEVAAGGGVASLQTPQAVQVRATTVAPIEVADPRLPLSSAALLSIVTAPGSRGIHVYVHESRPDAGCHLDPPSTETSTAATRPPPESTAVPAIVTGVPFGVDTPFEGAVIDEVGAE